MYAEDSFFTLGPVARIGLVGLSLALSAATLFLAWGLGRGRHWGLRLALGVGSLWAFAWLSPQVYYLYYQVVLDGLPWQIVVKAPPGPAEIIRLLGFSARPTLSDHGKGLLGWALILLAAWPSLYRPLGRRS